MRLVRWTVLSSLGLGVAMSATACIPGWQNLDLADAGDASVGEAAPDLDGTVSDVRMADGALDAGDARAQADGSDASDGGTEATDASDGGEAGCAPGTTPCADAGVCASLSSDNRNCGACGHDCTALPGISTGAFVGCSAGRCTYECLTGYADCADAGAGCISVAANPNCGACNADCADAGELCSPGADAGIYACTLNCTGGTTLCGTTCVNETTNAQPNAPNCNGCGPQFACTGGKTCQSSACQCPGTQMDCGGTCTNTMTDNNNCGGCGSSGASHVCPSATQCTAGQCECTASGLSLCGSTCVDLSSNKLNCGRCTHSCQGGLCFTSACQPFSVTAVDADAGYRITGLAANSSDAYITTNAGSVAIFPLNGGTSTGGITAGGPNPGAIVVNPSGGVYWTLYGSGNADGTIMTFNRTGTPVPFVSGQTGPTGLAVDSANVYWTNYPAATGGSAVLQTALDGGSPAVSLGISQNYPDAIAVDATSVYWIDQNSTIMKAPIGGGAAPMPLATAGNGALGGIAVDAVNVYWTTGANGLGTTVMKVPVGGGNPTPLATSQAGPTAVTLDSTGVYWTNTGTAANSYADGAVMWLPAGQTAPVTVVSGANAAAAGSLATNTNSIFWIMGIGSTGSMILPTAATLMQVAK